VRLVPRAVPDLAEHQVIAAQLATNGIEGAPIYASEHVGRIVAVRRGPTVIAGPLKSVTDSLTEPLLILEIGEFKTAVLPDHPVTVAPAGHRLTIVARPADAQS